MKGTPKASIDPRLEEALKSAGDEGTVEAVLMFHGPGAAVRSRSPKQDLAKLVASLAKSEPLDVNYFPNLRSVALRAKGRVVKRFLKHPQLAVATLNQLKAS